MLPKMAIRPARSADREEWARMRHTLWPECSQERHALEIDQLTGTPERALVLVAAREDSSLCGFAEVSIRNDHVDGASSVPVAYLEGWYVDPNMRKCGIGRLILDAVEDWAIEHGLVELASDAELRHEESI